jgi:phytoene desaturase
MNYADFGLGTWHPKGGMYEVIKGMETLSKSLGVNFVTSANVTKISVENNTANGIYVNDNFIASDLVLSGADYAHTEQLLPKNNRQYTDKYWEKKTFAPSSLLFYVAFDKPIENVEHHTLFFDTDFEAHAKSIYDTPEWPKKPLFYASFPSKTDETIAPKGKEAATFLIPLAPGIEDSDEIREIYFDKIIERLEYLTKQEVKSHIIFKESYGIDNFIEDYNSYKGNAYGLANTLFQTAFLRPKLKSKKVNGLYFTGQLTVPGPGVPPSLISGKLTADLINKYETNL